MTFIQYSTVQEVLEKTRQLDEKYAAIRVAERHHIKKEAEGNSTSVSSRQNATKWLDLTEMQHQLKETISEEQVWVCYLSVTI